MPIRLVSLLLVILAVSAVSQQTPRNIQNRINAKTQQRDQMNLETAPLALAPAKAHLQVIHQEAEELSALSASVQSDLQQLEKGFLVKDLHEKLRKMEKLSKRLRQDMQQ